MTRLNDLTAKALSSRLNRRTMLRRAAAVGIALPTVGTLLAACGSDDEGDPTSTTVSGSTEPTAPAATSDSGSGSATETTGASESTTTTTEGSGKTGGTARVAVAANPASWDLTKSTWPTWQSVHFMVDRLLVLDEDEELQPCLVTDWEISEDGMEYTLHLRDDVTFHDGEPFNAEAVKFNIERHIESGDSASYTTYEPVDHIEVVDDYTAKIVLRELKVFFAYNGLALWGAMQISPKAASSGSFDDHPIGTGAFKFDSYEPGSSIKYVRNDDYWNGAPLLDGIEVRIIPETNVQLVELQAGTIEVIGLDAKDVGTAKDAGATIETTTAPGVQFISINVSREPTSDLAVRQAIAYAIDRDTIIDQVLFGYAEKSRAGVNSNSPFYTEDVPMIDYDPDKAEQILEDAGWTKGDGGIRKKDGKPLSVSILSSDFAGWGLYNQIIQEQLKKVGIDSEISTLEWNAYLDQWRENQGDWNVTYHSQGSVIASASAIQASWAPESYWSITQIDDATTPELQQIATELQTLSDNFEMELDSDKRKDIAKRAQMLFQENQLTVWLWHGASLMAIQPKLTGYTLSHAGRIIELDKASLA